MQPPAATSLLHDRRGLSSIEYAVLFILLLLGALALWAKLGRDLVARVSGGESELSAALSAAQRGGNISVAPSGARAAPGSSAVVQPVPAPTVGSQGPVTVANLGPASAQPAAPAHVNESAATHGPDWSERPLGTGGKVAVVAAGAVAGATVAAGVSWGTAYAASLLCGPAAGACAGGVTLALVGAGAYHLATGGWGAMTASFGRVFSSQPATVNDALAVGTVLGGAAYGVTGGFGRGASILQSGANAGTATRQAVVDALANARSATTATTTGSGNVVGQAAGLSAAEGGMLDPEYVRAVAEFKGQTPHEVESFYAKELAKGIDHRTVIAEALKQHPQLTRAEAEAIYGYTGKQWYRELNQTLEAGGAPRGDKLVGLLESGLSKMPNSTSPRQYRGLRLSTPEQLAKFDAEYAPGNTVQVKSFWSTAPDPHNAYTGSRNLVIKTDQAKDITELAFGKHFHGVVGKQPYTAETVIPAGCKFRVVEVHNGTAVLEPIP